MRDIQFVSYDGEYPNLCSGKLTLSVNGELFTFDHCLNSGGCAGVDFVTFDEYCETGEWSLNSYEYPDGHSLGFGDNGVRFSREELELITELVNENVSHGCCGGCI